MRILLVLIGLFLAGCDRGFSPQDPLAYTQPRPVAPYDSYVAPTGSMAPEFKAGDVIHVSKARIDDIKVRDVIVSYWEGAQIPVMHRVIEVFRAGNGAIGLVTKGDANQASDPHITTEKELVGLATKVR